MKGRIIVLGRLGARRAAALIENGRLSDFLTEPADPGAFRPGTVCRAVVERRIKGQGGVFVRLPGGAAGFLRQAQGLSPGQSLPVQVTGHAGQGKAAPVTARLLFKSRHAIVTPGAPGLNVSRRITGPDERARLMRIAGEQMAGRADGLIIRSAAKGAGTDDIAEDIAAMRDLAAGVMAAAGKGGPELLSDGPDPHDLARREWAADQLADGDDAFADHGIVELLAPFRAARAPLPGGASMYVEPTRALVAVDVNTGSDLSPAAALKANLSAAGDLPRQLRVRGLGGQIVVDFAPVAKKDRPRLEQGLRTGFRADPVETSLVGWTPLGHFELQRKRERCPLSESLPR